MNEIPKATHSGTWVIDEENDIKIECYVMDNKERVLSLRGAARGIGIKGNGSQALTRNYVDFSIFERWVKRMA